MDVIRTALREPSAGATAEAAGDVLVVVTDVGDTTDAAASALRRLAELARGRRAVAVIGALRPSTPDALEENDRIGRLAVRLGIGLLVAVGPETRHIAAAAGLEGSWDGESQYVPDEVAAYDRLCELLRPGDIVLVTPATPEGLEPLADRLGVGGRGVVA